MVHYVECKVWISHPNSAFILLVEILLKRYGSYHIHYGKKFMSYTIAKFYLNGGSNHVLSSIFNAISCLDPSVTSDLVTNRLLYRALSLARHLLPSVLHTCWCGHWFSVLYIQYPETPQSIFNKINNRTETDTIKRQILEYNGTAS